MAGGGASASSPGIYLSLQKAMRPMPSMKRNAEARRSTGRCRQPREAKPLHRAHLPRPGGGDEKYLAICERPIPVYRKSASAGSVLPMDWPRGIRCARAMIIDYLKPAANAESMALSMTIRSNGLSRWPAMSIGLPRRRCISLLDEPMNSPFLPFVMAKQCR